MSIGSFAACASEWLMTTISQPKTIKTENVLINEPVKEVVSNVVSQHKCNNMSFTCHLQFISHVTRWFGTSFFFSRALTISTMTKMTARWQEIMSQYDGQTFDGGRVTAFRERLRDYINPWTNNRHVVDLDTASLSFHVPSSSPFHHHHYHHRYHHYHHSQLR